jgi:hypothetical protein
MEAINILNEKAMEKGIKINGSENVPFIVQGRPLFDLEGVDNEILEQYGQTSDDIFMANGFHNIALFPDGNVSSLKTVSKQYKVVQHGEAILKLFEELPESFETEKINITVSPNGGKCFARFTSKREIEVKEGDTIKYQVLLENSADTTRRFNITAGAWRLICSNGMVVPDNRVEQISQKSLHKNTLSLCGEIKSFLDILEVSMKSMEGFKEYTKKKISIQELERTFEALEVGPRVQEEILDTELRGENKSIKHLLEHKNLYAWDFYNAFTQRITDSEALESVKIENGAKIANYFDELVIN